MKILENLKDFIKENKFRYIIGIILLIIVDIIQLLLPQIIRSATNLLEAGELTMDSLVIHSLLIVLIGLLMAAGRYSWRIYLYGTSRNLEFYLRNKLFNHLLTLSPDFYNNTKTGDLMAHATNDINAVRMTFGHGVMMVIDAVVLTILTIFSMAKTTNIKFTIIALTSLPFISIFGRKFSQVIHRKSKKVQEAFSNLSNQTQESFSGIRVIKSFVQEKLVIDKFLDVNKDNLDKNLSLAITSGLFHPLIQFISSISFFILLLYGGRQVIYENIQLGDFVAFTNYLNTLIWPMMAIGWVINLVQRGFASLERINTILNTKPSIVDLENSIDINNIKGKIEFKNLSFKYNNTNKDALHNINFTIDRNETLAIIGRTGSGKSTIIKLLLRLYDDYDGEILIDNINIKDFTIESLRNNIAYIPQDNFLFSRSIKDNIEFSLEDNNDNIVKVHEAAKFAEVYDNIIAFPEGFDTILGERGVTLSGGQKQRVSIARAIIKNAKILIFDDSFSSVDTNTEEKILNNIANLKNRRTNIIISHRISTIKNADKILVVDDGEIIQFGNHESLLNETNGFYSYLYEKQLLEDEIGINYIGGDNYD